MSRFDYVDDREHQADLREIAIERLEEGRNAMTADTPAASKDAPTDEAVMVNIAGNAQDLERAKEHARLLLKRVAAGPVGDGLSHAEYALLCLYAHVATLTAQLEAERAEFSVDRTCNGNLQVGEDESVLAREIDVVVVAKKCVYVDDHRIAGSKPYVSENLPQHSLKTTIEHALAPFSSSVLMAALCKRDPALRSEYTTALTRETARADAAVAEAKALREAAEQAYGYLWVTSAMVPKDDPVSLARKRLLDEIGGWNSAGQRRGIAFATDQFEVGPDGVRPKRATLAQPAADGGAT